MIWSGLSVFVFRKFLLKEDTAEIIPPLKRFWKKCLSTDFVLTETKGNTIWPRIFYLAGLSTIMRTTAITSLLMVFAWFLTCIGTVSLFFYLRFLSWTFRIHRTVREGYLFRGGYLFNSCLLPLPASQAQTLSTKI